MSVPAEVLRSVLEKEVPALVPLLDQHPSIPIYTRADPQFEDRRGIYNVEVNIQPLAITCPASEAEVVAIVRACATAASALPICVRVGGHDLGGRTLVADAVVIDLRRVDGIVVAADRASARVGGGTFSGALVKVLHDHALMTPTGWTNTVGYVGWATGGGYGSLLGTHGLGVDQILGARVVTAQGEVVDTDDDPELLWALRGAGTGVFGVIVELRIKTYPIPKMLGGLITFALQDAEKVITGVGELPDRDEFSGEFLALQIPGLGPVLSCLFTWTRKVGQEDGPLDEGRALLEKVCSMGNVIANTVTETTPYEYTFALQQGMLPGMKVHLQTRLFRGLTPKFAEIVARNPTPGASLIIIHNAHGSSIRPDAYSPAAFAARKPHLVVGVFGTAGLDKDLDETTRKWVADCIQSLDDSGEVVSGEYMSFWHPSESRTLEAFGQAATERLRSVKKKHDSTNVFSGGYPSLA